MAAPHDRMAIPRDCILWDTRSVIMAHAQSVAYII